jgi:hypothetical protein
LIVVSLSIVLLILRTCQDLTVPRTTLRRTGELITIVIN